jgi:hypothetical protein
MYGHVEIDAKKGKVRIFGHSLDFGRTEVLRIDSDQNSVSLRILPNLLDTLTRPSMRMTTVRKNQLFLKKMKVDRLTLSPHRAREMPSRQTRAHSAFHQLRGQNLPVHPAGAYATYPPRSHGLRGQ